MNKKILIGVLLLAFAILMAIIVFNLKSSYVSDSDNIESEDNVFDPQYSGNLTDVNGGEASGFVQVDYTEGNYQLVAVFENLPELEEGYFYEGWISRQSDDSKVVSTGKVEAQDGLYLNVFNSIEDLSGHDFYMLTLEPDDGNPAPAEHVVEGNIY